MALVLFYLFFSRKKYISGLFITIWFLWESFWTCPFFPRMAACCNCWSYSPRKKYIEIHITRAKKGGGGKKKAVEREINFKRDLISRRWLLLLGSGWVIYIFFSLLLLFFSSLGKRVEFNLVNIPSWNKLMVMGLSCVCVCADGPIDCS